jgi:integrase
MTDKLTDKAVRALQAPVVGNRVTYFSEVKGLGVRVTKSGARSFVLNYRVKGKEGAAGRERRITIGSYPDWSAKAAVEKAEQLRARINGGEDPMGALHAARAAPTINDLAYEFEVQHLANRRTATQTDYKSILRLYIRPQLGQIKVSDIRHSDVEKMHRTIAMTAPYRANRSVAVLSKMLSLAVKWEMRSDNPARGIERLPEAKRERFLTPAEIERLAEVLRRHPERTTCNAIRLLLLTGARRGEMLSARWSEFDLAAGVWVKPSAHTKQAKTHRVPLSAPALALLTEMRAEAQKELRRGGKTEFLFPGQGDGPIQEPKRAWRSICRQAGLGEFVQKFDVKGKPVKGADGKPLMVWQSTVRIHDLRHTYASILASAGLSLPVIGALLGHTQAATTQRYAHLLDDPLRAATERVGAIVSGTGKPVAEV